MHIRETCTCTAYNKHYHSHTFNSVMNTVKYVTGERCSLINILKIQISQNSQLTRVLAEFLGRYCRHFCHELITRSEESYRLRSVVVCNLETSWMRRPWPSAGYRAKSKQTNKLSALSATNLLGKFPLPELERTCSTIIIFFEYHIPL